jgi:hypothetical protein
LWRDTISSLWGSIIQSNLLNTRKGMITSPYSWGLNKPRRTSSQMFQMREEISWYFISVFIYKIQNYINPPEILN